MPLPKGFLAESLGRIKPSPTIAVTTLAAELKRALRRIIDEHTPAGRHA